MKKLDLFKIIIIVVIVYANSRCTKELPRSVRVITGVTGTLPPNRPPLAHAGSDFTGTLYSNEMTLRGWISDPDIGDTITTIWTKIAGPVCSIVSSQSISIIYPPSMNSFSSRLLTTLVANLLVGEYKFELLARDNRGGIHRDTVAVKINSIESISSPINLSNLSWSCSFGCGIPIYEIYSHIPSNTPIRVLIKPTNTATWFEAIPSSQYPNSNSKYYYRIDANNTIWLSTDDDVDGNIDVRIIF